MQFFEMKYQDAATRSYLGSPSIVRLENGELLATHDYFGPGCPHNHENEEHLTSVYRSADDGRTWVNVTHIANAFWSTLFLHGGAVYLIGTSQQYGSIFIRRSEDGGNTWTHPADKQSGILFRGGFYHDPPNYHCAPMPMLFANGRVYRAFEDCSPLNWPRGFCSCVISAPDDSDLLDARNWRMTNKLAFDPNWVPESWQPPYAPGWLEGNVLQRPDGSIVNVLRFNSSPNVGKAAVLDVSDDGTRISFDPERSFIDFPGGMTKFTIRRDTKTGLYLSLVNNNTDPSCPTQRNVLSLSSSPDLISWEVRKELLRDDLPLSWEDSLQLTGFQYVDWQFDGEDIIYLVRTGYDGAHTFHDSNRMTFHKLENYEQYLK